MVPSDQEAEKYDIIGRIVKRLYDMPVEDLKNLHNGLAENNLGMPMPQYERQHDRKKCVITVDYATASRAFKDYIQDIIEIVMGTDPNDPTSFIPIAIPSEACIDNTEEVTVSYDFSIYFNTDYSFADDMEATFPAGASCRGCWP